MKRALMIFGATAVAAAALTYPLRSQAYWVGEGFAGCQAQYDSGSSQAGGYYFYQGGNVGPRELFVVCGIPENDDWQKTAWRSATLKVKDGSVSSSIKAQACLTSESGSGGGCGAIFSSTGSKAAIETLTIPAADLAKFWVSASGYASLYVTIPPTTAGDRRSPIIGYYVAD